MQKNCRSSAPISNSCCCFASSACRSAQTETLASLDLTPAPLIFASIVVDEDLAAPSAVSSTDKMKEPKHPPLCSTRPPPAPTTAAAQSASAKPAPARSYLIAPEKAQRPEFTGHKAINPCKNGFPVRLRNRCISIIIEYDRGRKVIPRKREQQSR